MGKAIECRQLNVRLDPGTMDVLRSASEASGISMTDLIRASIRAQYGDGQAARVARAMTQAVESIR